MGKSRVGHVIFVPVRFTSFLVYFLLGRLVGFETLLALFVDFVLRIVGNVQRINVSLELDELTQQVGRLLLKVGHGLCGIGVTR